MTRRDKILLLAVLAVLALVAAHALLSVDVVKGGRKVVSRVELKNLDPANNGINIEVTQPWFNPKKELSFNVGKPDERNFDRFDVTRCLLQCAQELGEHDFSRIFLCNKGDRLYYINAEDFKRLGEQYKNGETLNTLSLYVKLPQVTYTLNDSLAFPAHDGMLSSIADAQDWNTMMSNLLR
ncbi:MAG: hypothetical protein IJM58_03870 [Muribaculaceae bacterium]|nr:hypothetical protein [Muribaculaceae bacterium]